MRNPLHDWAEGRAARRERERTRGRDHRVPHGEAGTFAASVTLTADSALQAQRFLEDALILRGEVVSISRVSDDARA